jgi:hypothetical protein
MSATPLPRSASSRHRASAHHKDVWVASASAEGRAVRWIGVASGTNGAFREVGGVFGVAILAVVFAQLGGFASPQTFADGFGPAMWVGTGLPALGIFAALLAPKRQRSNTEAKAEVVTAAEPFGRCAGRQLDEATA